MRTNKGLAILAIGCVASLALGGAVLNTATASAEASANKFEMEYGVQVALKKDAMRWIVEMGENVYDEIVTNDNVSLSFIVSSKNQFDKVSGNYVDIPAENKTVMEIPDDKIYQSGDYYYANAALTGLYTTQQIEKDVVAIAVITTENNGAYTYEYANFNGGDINNNVRQQYDVLQKVVLDTQRSEAQAWAETIVGENTPYAWFGTEEYPLVVDTEAEYESFVTRINSGFNMNVNVDLYTDIMTDVEITGQMPARLTKYHTVNFYNEDELLDTVTVKDGEEAVCDTEMKSYSSELMYANSSNYVKGYKFDKWVMEQGGSTAADVASVTDSMNVYAKFYATNVTADLLSYAQEETPNSPLLFDCEAGFTQIKSSSGADPITDREYITDPAKGKIMAGEKASTKVTYTVTAAKSGVAWADLDPVSVTYSENDYISFYIYAEAPENVTTVWVRLGSTPGVQAKANMWTLVTFNAKAFMDYGYLRFDMNGYEDGDQVSLYFSKATIVPAANVQNMTQVEATDTWQLGDTTMVGTAAKVGWATDYRTDIFKQDTELNPMLINGGLLYYGCNTAFGNRWIGLEFETAMTGKVYITARGLSTVIADGKMPYLNLYTSRGSTTRVKWVGPTNNTIVKTLEDGYQVYEFDFGTTPIKYISICSRTEIAGQQIMIKNISTTY